jgi:hypothetical protein
MSSFTDSLHFGRVVTAAQAAQILAAFGPPHATSRPVA